MISESNVSNIFQKLIRFNEYFLYLLWNSTHQTKGGALLLLHFHFSYVDQDQDKQIRIPKKSHLYELIF